jgi:hypothetical protein
MTGREIKLTMRRNTYNHHTGSYHLLMLPVNPVRRFHRLSVLGLLFIAAISPSLFLATLHQFEVNMSIQQQQQIEQKQRQLRKKPTSSVSNVSSKGFDLRIQHSQPISKSQSMTAKDTLTQHVQSYNNSNSDQSCIILFIPMKNMVGNLHNRRNMKKQMKISNMTLHHYLSSSSKYILNGYTNVVILTDNAWIVNAVHDTYTITTPSMDQPTVHALLLHRHHHDDDTELTRTLQSLHFISSCNMILHNNDIPTTAKNTETKGHTIIYIKSALQNVIGNAVSLIRIDITKQHSKQLHKISNHPQQKSKKWNISKVGLVPCRLLSGNRQGFCNRWFQ